MKTWLIVIKSGLLTGLIGGAFMLLFLILQTASSGLGYSLPLQANASLFFGLRSLVGGMGVLLVGLAIQGISCAVLGVIFAVLVHDQDLLGATAIAGVIYGLLVWAAMTNIVLPLVNPVMSTRMALIPSGWLVAHLIFGVLQFLSVPIRQAMSDRLAPQERGLSVAA